MKQYIIRLATLLCALPVSGMVIAHPDHDGAGGISHHFVSADNLATMVLLVLVVGCFWAFARRQ